MAAWPTLRELRKQMYRVRLAWTRRNDEYRPALSIRCRDFYHNIWSAGATRMGANFEVIESEKPIAFSPLNLDDEMRVTFLAPGLQTTSIPAVGKEIMVKLVVNQNAAGQNL